MKENSGFDLERFPYVQLHYDVEAAADEIQYGDDLWRPGKEHKSHEGLYCSAQGV